MTESPIERKMVGHLEPMLSILGWSCEQQVRFGRYVVDFLVTSPHGAFAVECDGHTYHDRTDEQATKDRKRDRFLLRAYHVITIRFSSSEIFANVEACVTEVIQTIASLAPANDEEPCGGGAGCECWRFDPEAAH